MVSIALKEAGSKYAMAQPGGIRALCLAMLVAGTASSCVAGAVRAAPYHAGATPTRDGAAGTERLEHTDGSAGFDPGRFSRASALARIARALERSADELSNDGDRICTGSSPPPAYCAALQRKVAELRAMASRALTACRQVSAGMLTEVGGESLCISPRARARRVLVIRPVVP